MKKKSDNNSRLQAVLPLDLSENDHPSAPTAVGANVMIVIKRLMQKQRKSRDELADYLSEHKERRVLVATIEKMFAPHSPFILPSVVDLFLICRWLGSVEPLRVMVKELGADVVSWEGLRLMEVGKAAMLEREAGLEKAEKDRLIDFLIIEKRKNGR